MRSILFMLLLLVSARSAAAQTIDEQTANFARSQEVIGQIIEEHRQIEGVTYVEIGKAMTMMLATKLFAEGDDQSAQLLRSIDSIDILVGGKSAREQIAEEVFALPSKCASLALMSSIDSDGELIRFYFAEHSTIKKCEFLMIVSSPEECIMLYITGDFSVSDISSLSSLSEEMVK